MIAKYQNILAWSLGIGIVSFAFRDYYFNGTAIGLAICTIVLFLMLIIYRAEKDRPQNVLGSKFVWIPLLIICLSIVVSGVFVYFNDKSFNILLTRITIAVIFFGVYLACRILGEKVFKPFAIAVVVETASVVIYSLIVNYGFRNGGFSSVYDYNPAVGLLLFGAIVSVFCKQWVIVMIASIGLFFTGAEEAVFCLGIIVLAIIIRRDFSKKILLPIILVPIIVILGVYPFNYTKDLYAVPIDKVSVVLFHKHNEQALIVINKQSEQVATVSNYVNTEDYVLNNRLNLLLTSFKHWNWLGSGYVMNPVDKTDYTIYNVPLVIAEQIGIIGALAWLFITIFCLVKTKWKYAFIAIIALGLLDNYVWCQLGIWWFALVGVTTVSKKTTDLIYKKV